MDARLVPSDVEDRPSNHQGWFEHPAPSAVSSWEIAIKYALGKLPLPDAPSPYVTARIRASALTPLAIEHGHALRVENLPLHHRDPFDRLLVAQAIELGVPTLTADPAFVPYEVDVLPATG